MQIDLLKAFKGDATKLGNAEKFFLEVMDIPRLAERLNCFVYKKEFHSRVAELVAVCSTKVTEQVFLRILLPSRRI